jgi:hypothetical protein
MKRTSSGVWVPNHLRPARKFVNVVFYFNKSTNHVSIGAPESFPLPTVLSNLGYQKVVCRSAKEVDTWSQKMRDQERRQEEMTDEQREAFEGPLRAMIRGNLVTQMLNSSDAKNREFCRQAIANIDAEEEARKKIKRVSYMHAEANEDGH